MKSSIKYNSSNGGIQSGRFILIILKFLLFEIKAMKMQSFQIFNCAQLKDFTLEAFKIEKLLYNAIMLVICIISN